MPRSEVFPWVEKNKQCRPQQGHNLCNTCALHMMDQLELSTDGLLTHKMFFFSSVRIGRRQEANTSATAGVRTCTEGERCRSPGKCPGHRREG